MREERLILFAHGSRDPAWREVFDRMARDLNSALGEDRVLSAYLERAEPTLLQAVGRASADGAEKVLVLPMFFSSGGHVARDIPRRVEEVRSRFRSLRIELLAPIGEHPSFAALVAQVVRSALGRRTSRESAEIVGFPRC